MPVLACAALASQVENIREFLSEKIKTVPISGAYIRVPALELFSVYS
jgi:hypothetical protein